MKKTNAVGWFDIYVNDMNRAKNFYETILNTRLKQIDDPTGDTVMMSFNADLSTYGSAGAIVKSNYAKPGAGGTLVYFIVDDCLDHERLVNLTGGKVIRPKFSIGEYGWITICEDTEGNLFGLNSMK